VWPFQARQTGTVNCRFPQSVRGPSLIQAEGDIETVFTAEPTSGWGAGSFFGS